MAVAVIHLPDKSPVDFGNLLARYLGLRSRFLWRRFLQLKTVVVLFLRALRFGLSSPLTRLRGNDMHLVLNLDIRWICGSRRVPV